MLWEIKKKSVDLLDFSIHFAEVVWNQTCKISEIGLSLKVLNTLSSFLVFMKLGSDVSKTSFEFGVLY